MSGVVRAQGDGTADGGGQPLRADARRNHEALIDAAAALFATLGVDAPIRAIADRARVGVGTVYRRFPTRADLIEAVFRREVEACSEAAGTLAGQHEPFDALTRWIERYVDLIITKRGLGAALHSDDAAYQALAGYFEDRLTPPVQALLAAASHEIGANISATDLLRGVGLLCSPAASGDVAQTRRMVALFVNGLRVPSLSDSGTADR